MRLSKMARRRLLSGQTGSKAGGAADAQSTDQTTNGNVPQHAFVAVSRRNEYDDGSGRQEDNATPYLSAKKGRINKKKNFDKKLYAQEIRERGIVSGILVFDL